ncbi:MAG: Smr/MutS family protein, partial [Prolixibacteraceae bacterium]|nr:Smr/MutS family protein [Prolixibacteraceae bacterium]
REESPAWKEGDRVRIRGQELTGELVSFNERNGVVAFGQLLSTMPLRNLEKTGDRGEAVPVRKGRSGVAMTLDFSERRMNFKTEIDVRGERAEAALARIRAWLDDSVMFQVGRLRILHGKGEGILKEMIRAYLRSEPVVRAAFDEDVRFGGAGITVVELDL